MNLKLYFTKNELTMILANADVISDNSIVLNTDKYFFEINIFDEELSIYCYSNKKESYISKNEFLKLYNKNNIKNLEIITID
jgi:CTP:phosphocholine cytidylyltransferase-like protein